MTKKELYPQNPNNAYLKSYTRAVRQGSKIQQVVPHNDGWAVKKITGDKPSAIFATKEKAVFRACEIAKNQKTEVLIHNKDGKISKRIPCGTTKK